MPDTGSTLDSLQIAISASASSTDYAGAWAIHGDSLNALFEMLHREMGRDFIRTESAEVRTAVASRSRVASSYERIESAQHIAMIRIHGIMMKHESKFGPSTVAIRRAIRHAVDDSSVKGIALHVESPGGTLSGMKELAEDIHAAAQKKPVHAFIEDLGAAAAYWAASQATRIVANVPALIGSIGTFSVIEDLSKRAKIKGIRVHVIRAGDFKASTEPGIEISEETLAQRQSLVNSMNEIFIAAVNRGRKRLSIKQVRALADGRVHIAKNALAMGLIDEVAPLETMIDNLATQTKPGFRSEVPAVTPQMESAKIEVEPAPKPAARDQSDSNRHPEEIDSMSATEKWNEKVAEAKAAGMDGSRAKMHVSRTYPGLRDQMVAEANANRPNARR